MLIQQVNCKRSSDHTALAACFFCGGFSRFAALRREPIGGALGHPGPGLTLYGLRHTVAVILRELGYDERTIADALGQKTIEMARHYSEGADLKPKMRGVVASFDAELNRRRTKTVKPTG